MAWIIGDVHGCIKTLKALLEKIPNNEKIIFVGDLVDRGLGSQEVIKLIRDNNYDCVKGNHEVAMIKEVIKLLKDNSLINKSFWIRSVGGLETLKSYNSSSREDFVSDVRWLNRLPLYRIYPEIINDEGRQLVVSHAAVGLYWLKKDSPRNSSEYIDFKKGIISSRNLLPIDNPKIFNVFGHTPKKEPIIKKHFANIDTGACYKDDLGILTALEFPTMQIIQQENIDD